MKDIEAGERYTPNKLNDQELEKVVGGKENPNKPYHPNNNYQYCKKCRMQTPVRFNKYGQLVCDPCGTPFD